MSDRDDSTLNLKLLRYLKKQKQAALPSEIESALDVEHGALIGDLEALAAAGYEIELHPYLGVRLVDIPDRLLAHEISEGLNTRLIGATMHIQESCRSTSDEAWAAIESGKAEDGELFLANHQSGGRGRMGRAWESKRGAGLYLSFVAKPRIPADKAIYVTCAAALAVANTIEQFAHLPAEIKWPNDVLIGGRKAAGVLVEARSTHPDVFVVGIGLNVNQREDDFPEHLRGIATSLRIERKAPVHRVRLLRPLLFYLDGIYAQLRKRKFDRIGRAWREYVHAIGKRVTLRHEGADHSGELLSIDPGEGVRLRDDAGREHNFRAEHVMTLSVGA